jgi:DNA-binding PadR family transcriptional regulator
MNITLFFVEEKEYLKPLERLKRKTGVENLWLYVLAELARGEDYPYSLIKRIREDFGVKAGKVIFYVVTQKLEEEGLIRSHYIERRKYFAITEQGREVLRQGISYLKELSERLHIVSGI